MEQTLDDILGVESPCESADLTGKIKSMAEFIAVEDEAVTALDDQLKARQANLDALKADLCKLLQDNGMESCKLDNGLTPKARLSVDIFKQGGVDDPMLFGWLKDNGMDGIIKPTVNWKTLSTTMKDFIDQGNDLPEDMFQRREKPTITLYGKSKFLAVRNAGNVI